MVEEGDTPAWIPYEPPVEKEAPTSSDASGFTDAAIEVPLGFAAETAMSSPWLPPPVPFVAVMTAFDTPAAVGVPEIAPVDVLIERPAGRPDAAYDVGVFDPVTWKLKAVPKTALATSWVLVTADADMVFSGFYVERNGTYPKHRYAGKGVPGN